MPATALTPVAAAVFFLVGAVAISALPPLNGFVSEWLTFQAFLFGFRGSTEPLVHLLFPAGGALLALTIPAFVGEGKTRLEEAALPVRIVQVADDRRRIVRADDRQLGDTVLVQERDGVADLLVGLDGVDQHVRAVGVDPGLGDLGRAVGHEGGDVAGAFAQRLEL